MPDLEYITDSSYNEENNVPLPRSFLETSEDENDVYGNYKVLEASGKLVNLKEGYDSMPELMPDYVAQNIWKMPTQRMEIFLGRFWMKQVIAG